MHAFAYVHSTPIETWDTKNLLASYLISKKPFDMFGSVVSQLIHNCSGTGESIIKTRELFHVATVPTLI